MRPILYPSLLLQPQRMKNSGQMPNVVIHSDGACHGNPGRAVKAAVLVYGEQKRELSGGVPATTNNRMELPPSKRVGARQVPAVEFHTDSTISAMASPNGCAAGSAMAGNPCR